MPFDLKLQRTCDHSIFDEAVSISGLSPNYFSVLQHQTDGSSNFMVVRELTATEGLSNFIYSRDGYSNWNLSTDGTQVNWNSMGMGGPGTGVASFLDAASHIMPQAQMLVSYQCDPDFCPLCVPSVGPDKRSVTKDIEFDLHGRLRTIDGNNKIKQSVFKALLTTVGTNEVLPDYGSTISLSIGQKFDALTEFRLYQSISQAVNFLIQEQSNNPLLPLNETILNLSSVNIAQDQTDPRIIRVFIKVQTGDFKQTEVTFNMITQ